MASNGCKRALISASGVGFVVLFFFLLLLLLLAIFFLSNFEVESTWSEPEYCLHGIEFSSAF